ncbi:TIGR02391 family protein [Streptomyces mayteni]
MFIDVEKHGPVDPVAAWSSMTNPKPVLEPDDVLEACDQMLGRLEAMERKAAAEAQSVSGVELLHPLVWGAASRLWTNEHFREAVTSAAETLVAHVQSRTGRRDLAATSLWQQVFSQREPRLRWPGDPDDQTVRSMNDGLRLFAPGAQMAIRNTSAHGTDEMTAQDALERLAVLSLLARWVDACEDVTASA